MFLVTRYRSVHECPGDLFCKGTESISQRWDQPNCLFEDAPQFAEDRGPRFSLKGETVGLLGVGWHTFRHTYRTLIDDVGTPLGVQQRLMRHADIKTTMNTYGSAFEKSKRRANSRVAALVLPPAIKRQLKDRAKEVSLQNLRPETAANYGKPVDRGANT